MIWHSVPFQTISFCSLTSQQIYCYVFLKPTLLFSSSLTFHILLSLATMSSIIFLTCLVYVYPFIKIQLNSLLCGQSIATPHPHLRHLSRVRHTLLCAISVSSMTITFIYITSLCMPFLYFQCLRYYAQI